MPVSWRNLWLRRSCARMYTSTAIVARVLRREHELGRPAPDLARVRAPVGIALGGRTPAEIAISIVAELVADRHGGSGAPMNVVPQAIARLGGAPAEPTTGRKGDARDDR